MKIAILVNESTMNRCTGKGCFNAFNTKNDSFKNYETEAELIAFTHAGGDIEHKIEKLISNGVEVVHLSTCLRAKNTDYEKLAQRLSKNFEVVGYTHGSEQGKNQETIFLKKAEL